MTTPVMSGGLSSKLDPIRWLVALRVVTVSTLFLTAWILGFIADVPFPLLQPLLRVIVFVYGLALVFLAVWVFKPLWILRPSFVYAQLAGDVAAATWLVYLTGGAESSFSFLYHIPIIAGSVLLYRRGAMTVASMSVIAYVGLVDLVYYGVVPPYRQAHFVYSFSYLYYYLISNVTGFFLVALLSGHLTERLRRKNIELDRLQVVHGNVLENMASGLLTTDTSGKIDFVNRAGLDLLGLPFSSLRERTMKEALPEFSFDFAPQTTPRRFYGECRYAVGEGGAAQKKILGFGVATLFGTDDLHNGWIVLLEDLTDIKAMEEALRLKDRMAALGEMAAGLAHEIRNPLASIRGSAQMLERSLRLPGEDGQLLNLLVKETERLHRTIEAFLHYARGGKGQRWQSFDVVPLLNETMTLLRNSDQCTKEHRIAIESSRETFLCEGDPDQFKQIFWNLSLNALQAMPEGGSLTIFTKGNAQAVEIIFSDTGRGIPPHERQNVILPFKSGSPHGLGLGLSIAYRIVEQHHGDIRIEGREGGGTQVIVRLPLAQGIGAAAKNVSREHS